MKLSWILAVAFCALTSMAWAQTGVPVSPAEPGAEEVQKRAERGLPSTWTYSLAVGESYESDASFSGAAGNGAWSRGLLGRLGKSWALRRGAVELGGDATHNAYHSNAASSRVTYGLNAGASYALTRRWSSRFGASVNQMYSQDAQLLTGSGVIFPRVLTRTQGTFAGFNYLLTPRSQLDVNVSTTRVGFVDSDLVPGTSLVTRAAFTRQVSRGQYLGVSVGHSISTITGDIEGLLGTWRMTAGQGLSIHAAGGVRPYKLNGEATGYSIAPGGSAGISVAFGRGQSAGFTYEYAVEQAYGVGGTHMANRFNGNYSAKIGRRLSLDGSGSYGRNTYPERVGYVLDGRTIMTAAQYLLGKQMSVGVSYGIWVRTATAEPSTTTYRAMVSLAYGGGWR